MRKDRAIKMGKVGKVGKRKKPENGKLARAIREAERVGQPAHRI